MLPLFRRSRGCRSGRAAAGFLRHLLGGGRFGSGQSGAGMPDGHPRNSARGLNLGHGPNSLPEERRDYREARTKVRFH